MSNIFYKGFSANTNQSLKQALEDNLITKKQFKQIKQFASTDKKALVALDACISSSINNDYLDSFFYSSTLVNDDKIDAIKMGYENGVPATDMEFLANKSNQMSNVRMMILQIGFLRKKIDLQSTELYCMGDELTDWQVEAAQDAIVAQLSPELIIDIRDNSTNLAQASERIKIAKHYQMQKMNPVDIKSLFKCYEMNLSNEYQREFIEAIKFGLGKEEDSLKLLADCYELGMLPEQIREIRLGLQTNIMDKKHKIKIKDRRLSRADARILMNPKLSVDRLRFLRRTMENMRTSNRDVIRRLADPTIPDELAICICPILLKAQNENQLKMISKILNTNLTEDKAKVLLSAFKNGVSIEKFMYMVECDFDAKQMDEVRKALENDRINDADIIEFINPKKKFDWSQMKQIRLCIQDGIPKGIREKIEGEIILTDEKGKQVLKQLDGGQMQQMRYFARNSYIPPVLFQNIINLDYPADKLEWIRKAFENGSIHNLVEI